MGAMEGLGRVFHSMFSPELDPIFYVLFWANALLCFLLGLKKYVERVFHVPDFW